MTVNQTHQLEWLEANGAGGFACGCQGGQIRRFWHGLLWIARKPPTNRVRLVAGSEERLVYSNGDSYQMFEHIDGSAWRAPALPYSFENDILPRWRWPLPGGGVLVRQLWMPRYGNTTLIRYALEGENAPASVDVCIRLILAHDPKIDYLPANGYLGERDDIPLVISTDAEAIKPTGRPKFGPIDIEHETEKDCEENPHGLLWYAPDFTIRVERDKRRWVALGNAPFDLNTADAAYEKEIKRRQAMSVSMAKNPDILPATTWRRLAHSADRFVVRRYDGLMTILAGYPWFTDWGRDTMISLTGLCLKTGRFEEAHSILEHFLNHVDNGLIPNLFPEEGNEPQFNTIDATLWLFEAIFRYARLSGDEDFLRNQMPVLSDMIDCHIAGTHQMILVDQDGLLRGGTKGSQLTWMDVKIDGHVPTPRHGKPVEIQGLWYNALLGLADWAEKFGIMADKIADWRQRAATCREQFHARFVSEAYNHLADVVDRDSRNTADWSIRPNMVLPFALTHNIIPTEARAKVLRVAADELVTPRGMRSLAPGDPEYKPIYRGDRRVRDHAYHQGTVWMWLIASYVQGVRAEAESVPELAEKLPQLQKDLLTHFLHEGCPGECNEIFDAEPPHTPRGCFAQAWSTAALIEVLCDA